MIVRPSYWKTSLPINTYPLVNPLATNPATLATNMELGFTKDVIARVKVLVTELVIVADRSPVTSALTEPSIPPMKVNISVLAGAVNNTFFNFPNELILSTSSSTYILVTASLSFIGVPRLVNLLSFQSIVEVGFVVPSRLKNPGPILCDTLDIILPCSSMPKRLLI